MSMHRLFTGSLLALGLAIGTAGGALAQDTHSHDGSGAGAELILNDGVKWETDDALRRGMTDIRNDMAAALPRIHDGDLTPAAYAELADKVDGGIEYLVENCKLTPEADEQLHVVLVEIMDGSTAMKSDADPKHGAIKIIQALDVYPAYFDHPGWQPVTD